MPLTLAAAKNLFLTEALPLLVDRFRKQSPRGENHEWNIWRTDSWSRFLDALAYDRRITASQRARYLRDGKFDGGRKSIFRILRAYTRTYRDSGQVVAYVEWIGTDGSYGRTEGEGAYLGVHMTALFSRARREGAPITEESW